MSRTHHSLVESGDVHENLVQIDILLVMRANEVMESMAGNRQNGLAVTLRIVEPVQKVNSTRPGCCDTDTQAAGEFGISLMPRTPRPLRGELV